MTDQLAPRVAASIPLGVEIGEHAMRLTVTRGTTPLAPRWQVRLPAPAAPAEALAALDTLIERALNERETAYSSGTRVALGVALWDGADAERGIVRAMRYAPGWEDYPLAERLAARWGGPVRLLAASDAAALAEAHVGAGQDAPVVLYILLARSVWSALVARGRVIHGAAGNTGRLAHWRVRTDGPRCSCGAYGHLEPFAAAQALVRNMIGRAAASDESTAAILDITGGRAEAMSARAVVQLAAHDDAAAVAVLADALDALASALANLIAVLDPALVVLGGPLAEAGDAFFDPLRTRVGVLCEPFTQAPAVVPGTLEPAAPLIGARLLAEGIGMETLVR
ncbi:MAG: ROK family protein [Ktedonobacterales bacterium]|nr:ROK family protein [Ktedonobacterales bacterium]